MSIRRQPQTSVICDAIIIKQGPAILTKNHIAPIKKIDLRENVVMLTCVEFFPLNVCCQLPFFSKMLVELT